MNRPDRSRKQSSAPEADSVEVRVRVEFQRLVNQRGAQSINSSPNKIAILGELLDQAEQTVVREERARELYANTLLDEVEVI